MSSFQLVRSECRALWAGWFRVGHGGVSTTLLRAINAGQAADQGEISLWPRLFAIALLCSSRRSITS